MKYVSAIITLLLLSACAAPRFDSICRENGENRPCAKHEQQMIDDMHSIIRAVQDFDEKNLRGSFLLGEKNKANPSVLLFGEKPREIIGRMETLGAINAFANKGGIILMDIGERGDQIEDCGLWLVLRIYVAWHTIKSGQDTDFDKIFEVTKASYDLSGLNIADLKCGFWDIATLAQKETPNTYEEIKERNQSMVKAIADARKDHRRVLVLANYFQLPTGDRFSTSLNNRKMTSSFPKTVADFYKAIKGQRKLPASNHSIKPHGYTGSAKVIYNYLNNNKISYSEYIHGKMYL